ncbi:hypothetical protein [Streptomyces altiplanensis]
MSVSYRNENTGDLAHFDDPQPRLEALPNWHRVQDGQDLPPVVNDGVLSRPTLAAPGVHDLSDVELVTNEEIRKEAPAASEPDAATLTTTEDGVVSGPGGGRPPAKAASKAEWQDYARLIETDPEAQSDIEGLTKEQLIDKYGDA